MYAHDSTLLRCRLLQTRSAQTESASAPEQPASLTHQAFHIASAGVENIIQPFITSQADVTRTPVVEYTKAVSDSNRSHRVTCGVIHYRLASHAHSLTAYLQWIVSTALDVIRGGCQCSADQDLVPQVIRMTIATCMQRQSTSVRQPSTCSSILHSRRPSSISHAPLCIRSSLLVYYCRQVIAAVSKQVCSHKVDTSQCIH